METLFNKDTMKGMYSPTTAIINDISSFPLDSLKLLERAAKELSEFVIERDIKEIITMINNLIAKLQRIIKNGEELKNLVNQAIAEEFTY